MKAKLFSLREKNEKPNNQKRKNKTKCHFPAPLILNFRDWFLGKQNKLM